MRKKFREVRPPEFLEGFVCQSSVVKLGLRSRGHGGFRRPKAWGGDLLHLDLLCHSTGVEVDMTKVELRPLRPGGAYSPNQWTELMSAALVSAAISTAYCLDDRAVLQDAHASRSTPAVRVSFMNMTAELLALSRKSQARRKAPRDFGEGHSKVAYVGEMSHGDLDNLFKISTLLSFFSCTASLYIEAAVKREGSQTVEGVMLATIETIAEAVEKFYFG